MVLQFRLLQYELAHTLSEHLTQCVHTGVAGLHVVNAVKDSYFVPSEKAECLDLIDGIPLCYERASSAVASESVLPTVWEV